MKNCIKLLLLVVLIPLFLACEQDEERDLLPKWYIEDALFLEKEERWSEALIVYSSMITSAQYYEDSVENYTTAFLNSGRLWLKMNYYDDAKNDFNELLVIAKRHELDSVLYQAYRNLTTIAIYKRDYEEALNIATKAKGIAQKHQWADNEFTDGWYEEFTIAQAHHELEQNKVLKTETISTLRKISQQDNIIFKSEALKLLALCYPTNNSILQEYFLLQDSIWNERLEVHSRHAQTIWLSKEQEYLNDLKYSQTYIIIACFTIVLLLFGFLYITFSKRLKYNKLKHKKLLNQKANAINNLKDKINYLKHRNIEIQAQITQTSIELRNVQFHEMKIGRFIPTKSNHNKLNQEDYKSLLTNRENITSFLKEISLCFPKLYNKLHIEKATTELELIKATYICLFCLDVRTSDIALMMCVQSNSVSSRKKRLKEELEYLDEFNNILTKEET